MTDLSFIQPTAEIPLVRSSAILRHAKGQPCTLRFPGICNANPETTVACHIRDAHKGMGIKASDYSVVFGCSDCHRILDEGFRPPLWPDIVRALQETWGILIRDGIIYVKQDPPKPKQVIKKRPKGKSRRIQNRSNFPPKGARKLQSKNTLRRSQEAT